MDENLMQSQGRIFLVEGTDCDLGPWSPLEIFLPIRLIRWLKEESTGIDGTKSFRISAWLTDLLLKTKEENDKIKFFGVLSTEKSRINAYIRRKLKYIDSLDEDSRRTLVFVAQAREAGYTLVDIIYLLDKNKIRTPLGRRWGVEGLRKFIKRIHSLPYWKTYCSRKKVDYSLARRLTDSEYLEHLKKNERERNRS